MIEARSRVAATWPFCTCFTVSTQGTPAMAAPSARAASSTARKTWGGVSGRAASCTVIHSWPSQRSMAAATLSWRRAPPSRRTTLVSWCSAAMARIASQRLVGAAMAMRSKHPAAAIDSSVMARTGRPETDTQSLSSPALTPSPKAGTMSALLSAARPWREPAAPLEACRSRRQRGSRRSSCPQWSGARWSRSP